MRSMVTTTLVLLMMAGGAQAQVQNREKLAPAPTDRSVPITKEQLAQFLKDVNVKDMTELRILEGGKFNVNIRRVTTDDRALVHPTTADLWIVLQGAGMLTTGGRIEGGKIVGGKSHQIGVGDIEFIPASVAHAVTAVDGAFVWMNIRWDTDWAAR